MKKIILNICFVVLLTAIFFQVPQVRLPLVLSLTFIFLWVVPFQLVYPVSYEKWETSILKSFSSVPREHRLSEVRGDFKNLGEIDLFNMRRLYIHIGRFYYMLMFLHGFVILVYVGHNGPVKSVQK